MKAKPITHRLKRVSGKLLILGMLVCVVLFMTGCKEEDKWDKYRDIYFNVTMWDSITGGLFYFEPCPYDHNLSPGNSFVFDIPDPPYLEVAYTAACSPAPWTLTATPSAGITAKISRSIRAENMDRYNCFYGVTLAESATPGAPVSISGPGGCISSGTDVIRVSGYGAAGTVTVNFD